VQLDCAHTLCTVCADKMRQISMDTYDTAIVQCPLCRASTNLDDDETGDECDDDDGMWQSRWRAFSDLSKLQRPRAHPPNEVVDGGTDAPTASNDDVKQGTSTGIMYTTHNHHHRW
jgi:hypothetical protein